MSDILVSNDPDTVVRVDLNGDGYEDLASFEATNSRVTVLLGYGDGTFATPQSYTVGYSPSSSAQLMVAADFNGDGHPDLAVVGSGGKVQILAGSASGTLTPRTPIALTGTTNSVGLVTGDFNGDGKPDLAVFESSTGQIAILTNGGSFTFTESDQSLLSGNPVALAATDVDGDGRVDLVAAIGTSKNLVVILNKTTGFSPQGPVTLALPPTMVAVADVNGDHKADVLVGFNDGSVSLFLGNGSGGVGAASPLGSAGTGAVTKLDVGDITGDTLPDLVALTAGTVAVWPSTGVGTWGNVAYFMPGSPGGLVVGDVNGDGHADVVVGASQVGEVNVLLAAPDTILAAPTVIMTTQTFGSAILVDVNGDGKLDSVAVSTATDEVGVFLNTGNGTFAPVATYGVGTGAHPAGVGAGDFNGDGKLDLAIASPGLGTIGILLGTATGFGPVHQVTATNANGVLVGDFNNDTKLDVLGWGSSGVTVMPGQGNGTFGAPIAQSSSPGDIIQLAALKVNKDQTLDLVGVTSTYQFGFYTTAFSRLGNGDGTFSGGVTINLLNSGGNPAHATAITVGDFNNDGNNDMVAYVAQYTSNGFFQFLPGDGTGTLTAPTSFADPFGLGSAGGITAGDFDGDGKLDLAVLETSGSGLGILLGNGAGAFSEGFLRTVSQPLQSIAAGDLAGDGRPSLFYGVSPGAGEMLNLCK